MVSDRQKKFAKSYHCSRCGKVKSGHECHSSYDTRESGTQVDLFQTGNQRIILEEYRKLCSGNMPSSKLAVDTNECSLDSMTYSTICSVTISSPDSCKIISTSFVTVSFPGKIKTPSCKSGSSSYRELSCGSDGQH